MNINIHNPVVGYISRHDSGVRVLKLSEADYPGHGEQVNLFFKDQADLAKFVASIAVHEFGGDLSEVAGAA